MTQDQIDKTLHILAAWFQWSNAWAPNLGAGRCSPECREYSTPDHERFEHDGDYLSSTLEVVDMVLGELPLAQRCAVGLTVRNKAGAAVWRSGRVTTKPEDLNAGLESVYKSLMKKGVFADELAYS